MITLFTGLKRESLNRMDQMIFDKYDKNGDGVISATEFNNFVAVSGVGKVNKTEKNDKGFNLEQFDPQGPINFESNGGFNSKRLNIIA